MTDADLEVLSRFEVVWERVLSGKAAESASPYTSWEPVLQGLWELERGYEALSRRAAGREKQRLQCLAAETRAMFDGLHTAYFLETGDIFLTKDVCDFASYIPYNLRKLWKNAVNLAELLQKGEKPLWNRQAETIRRQIETIEELTRNALQ